MSSGVKPTTIDEYERWLTKTHGVKTLPQMPNYFKSVAEAIRTAFENSAFWQTLCDKSLKEFDERYKLAHDNYPLLISADPPQLCAKSYASFLQKTGLVEQLPDLSRRELVDGVHQLFLTERIDGERSEDDVPNHELVAV